MMSVEIAKYIDFYVHRRSYLIWPSVIVYIYILLRRAILNRTYGAHKNLYISLFLLTSFGPIYYGPP